MEIDEKISRLRKADLFSETESIILHLIASATDEIAVRKGKQILKKGDPGDAMYIITEGEVRIHDGNHVLARLKENQAFGEYSLIDMETRSASVTAEKNCSMLRLSQRDFFEVAASNPGVLRGTLKVLIRRMREMNELEEKLAKSYLKIKSQKEKIERQNDSIKEQKSLLEQQNYDLTRLNEEKNDLISIIVHQIKNPLTSSLCLVEMLESDDTKLDQKMHSESIRVIRQSLRRINNLVTEVLDLNAIDSKVYNLKYEEIEPAKIISEIVDNYRYLLDQKGVDATLKLDDGVIKLNRVYFTQIVDNLLSNAVKASGKGQSVTVSFKITKDKSLLTVTDQGAGIEPAKLETIFGKYQRQTTLEAQDAQPEGLGLAIIHKYTTSMDGKIEVESSPGKGASFKIEFPLS